MLYHAFVPVVSSKFFLRALFFFSLLSRSFKSGFGQPDEILDETWIDRRKRVARTDLRGDKLKQEHEIFRHAHDVDQKARLSVLVAAVDSNEIQVPAKL